MPKKRNLLAYFGLYLATFGLYGIYWFYLSTREMLEYVDEDPEQAGMWTLLIALPILNLYAYWQQSKLLERVTDKRYPAPLMMVIWVFPLLAVLIVSPVGWLVTQHELNKLADRVPSQSG